jgi:hypothetical protein
LVINLINLVTNSWRFEILEELFDNVSLISSSYIALPLFPRPDMLTWIVDRKGVFSVKSALKLNQSLIWPANPDLVWHLLWKCKIHERLKLLCGALAVVFSQQI